MEASINERHLKDFVRLLQCASKYGDDLCINANRDIWELAVTNSSKSAFCLFKLRPRFFCRYKALGTPSQQRKGVKCELPVRSVLAVLGKASVASSIERLDLKIYDPADDLRSRRRSSSNTNGTNGSSAGTSDIAVQDGDDYHEEARTINSMLIIRLVCKHGVTKKHSLHLGSTEFLRAEVDPDSTPSSFTISASTLRNWLDHFSLTSSSVSSAANPLRPENQLGWMFGKNEVRLKNWEGTNKDLCTEIRVDVEEFGADGGESRYWVEQERVDLTLPMKEFRATLQLADSLRIFLTVAFSEATQPLTMVYTGGEEDDFDIFCAIATTTCDAFPADLGKGGAAVAGAGGGGAGGRMNGGDPPGVHGLDTKPRRTISDLTDDAPGPAGAGGRDGPNQAEGSRKRQRSETPSRRKGSRLDLTANERPASGPSVVYNSVPGSSALRGSSQRPSNGNADDQGGGGAAPDGGDNGPGDHAEPLFFPAGSQEEALPPPTTPRTMTQKEVMELAGMTDVDMDRLIDELDDAEDEEFSASQQIRQAEDGALNGNEQDDRGQGGESAGQVKNRAGGAVADSDDWDDQELEVQNRRHAGGSNSNDESFSMDNSIFDLLHASEIPAPAPVPPPSARRPLQHRLPSTPRHSSTPSRPPLQPLRPDEAPTASRLAQHRGSVPSTSRSAGATPRARVRTETEEHREEVDGVVLGDEGGGTTRQGGQGGERPPTNEPEEEFGEEEGLLGPTQGKTPTGRKFGSFFSP